MGTIHHGFAIAVSEYDHDRAQTAFEKVKDYARERDEFFQRASFEQLLVGPINSVANFTQTYFMAPDGSKEGWTTSNLGNKIREFFVLTMSEAGCSVASGSFGELQDTFRAVYR